MVALTQLANITSASGVCWDYAELMRRHNAIANDILEPGADCVLVIFEECSEGDKRSVSIGPNEVELQKIGPIAQRYWDAKEGVFEHPVCLFGAATKWNAGEFDGLISAAAKDEIKPSLESLVTGRAYAPYDGGADLFFLNFLERDLASQKFRNWLSARADGL